jgi:hypothetical protein
MKKAIILFSLIMASVAFGYEELLSTLTGTTSQTFIYGFRKTICLQSSQNVRYRLGSASRPPTATTADVEVAPGDCYRIDIGNGYDRIAVIHSDGVTSFTARIYDVVTK